MDERPSAIGRTPDVVGREAERARVDAFVATVPQGARALFFRGQPGIGKTLLWQHAVQRCQRGGFHVLVARPAKEETPLALSGLVDLFDRVDVDPAALDAASNPFDRGHAVLEVFRRLAEERPTVLAIDDLQWLDSLSSRALRHTLRRLDAEPVGVLATALPGADADDALAVASTMPPGRHEAIDLGPLSIEDLRRVLVGAVAAISRPLLRKIHEVSGGNPLYAIELARGIAAGGAIDRSATGVPLPDSLQGAIAKRLETVPAELGPLLETASALGPAPVRVLQDALPGSDVVGLLAVAEQHGLLVMEENLEVRFSHPLVGSGVYGRMSPLARRSLHGRLVELAVDPDVRARHLALSTDGVDPGIAMLLEEAAARASARGAFDLAAELARHSLRVTPPEDANAALRRALAEIGHLADAGEGSRALALADRLVAALPRGPGRAEALLHRADLEDDHARTAEAFLLKALEDAGQDLPLRGRVLHDLGALRVWFLGDVRGAIECAREVAAIADAIGDPEFRARAAASLGQLEALAGSPRPGLIATAVPLERAVGRPPLSESARTLLARQLLWAGDLSSARTMFEEEFAAAVGSGNELQRPYRLCDLALLECAAGNFPIADEMVRGGMEASRDAENTVGERMLRYPMALVEAWLGRTTEALATARRLLEEAERQGEPPAVVQARRVIGLLALSNGEMQTAALELTEAARSLEEMGFAHPGVFPVLPDAIEALVGSGNQALAAKLLERLEDRATAVESAWALAAAQRCRGALMLARADAEAAGPVLEAAVVSFDRLGFRPDAARAVFIRGSALLRAGHRTLATETLADACARFAGMGAGLWEARATKELERAAPGRPGGDLSETERRIAALVVRGMKNRQIAEALFLSVATVEAHLTRIYRKLDIRSRTELARLVADGSVALPKDETPPAF